MSFRKKLAILLGIALVAVVAVHTVLSFASTSQNIVGNAWSSNIGWVRLNDCTDVSNPSTCNPSHSYGINVDSATRAVDGYAWSSSIGWISFNSASVASCPAGFSQCGPILSATPNGNGSHNVQGWARACSVFVAGCSGTLKSNIERGGWDGFIALGDTNPSDAVTWGVTVNTDKTITGFAWGADVIGWLRISGSITDIIVDPTAPAISLGANPSSVTSGGSSTLTLTAVNFTPSISCSIDHGIGVVPMSATGPGSWSGSATATTITTTTTYTATCTGPSGTAVDTATVTVGGTSGGTCSDGIQNQNETGVDTGGVCAGGPSSGGGTCSDGIQNQDETGIDVGGICAGVIPPSTPKACADYIDNDGDGKIDYGQDPGCTSPTDTDEKDPRPIFIEF